MRSRVARLGCVLALLAIATIGHAEEIGWPEAVSRLARERYIAETCVSVLKATKNDTQIDRGRMMYATAKADDDAVIDGLLAALALNQQPASLPTLEAKLESSTTGLAQFCKMVNDLLPPNLEGQKGVLDAILKVPFDALLKTASEGIAALYNNHRKDG